MWSRSSAVPRMRKQYHLRHSAAGLLAWDIDRLIALTADLPARAVRLAEIRELPEPLSAR